MVSHSLKLNIVDETGHLRLSHVPETICFEPVYLCNIRCNYCYIGQEKNIVNPIIPSFEITSNILTRLKEEGVREVYLAGGEATAHPRFEDLCKLIFDLGFNERGLVTNGTLLNSEMAKLLKDLSFWVNVSFRGPNEDLVDKITQTPGSFHRALRGLHHLDEVGIKPGIEFDPIPENYLLLYETINLLVKEGISIREVWLHRIAPTGDALNNHSELSVEQYRDVFRQAKAISEQLGIKVSFEDSFPLCLIEEDYHEHTSACDCGVSLANVDPLGNLRRCACHPKQLGNILSTPLHELWQNELRAFRSLGWLPEACTSCALLSVCGGGCSVSSPSKDGFTKDRFSNQFDEQN